MKVAEVRDISNGKFDKIYAVKLRPNKLEKLFGKKIETREYKDTGRVYVFGGGHIYKDRTGKDLDNGSGIGDAIDKHRRSW